MRRQLDRKWILATLALSALATVLEAEVSEEWTTVGSKPKAYEMGTDTDVSAVGTSSTTIRSIKKRVNGFGSLKQTIPADEYHGQRIRLSGFLKTKDVDEWAGLWLRVDGHKRGKMLAFDNMSRRPVRGTLVDWTEYRVVLDVSEKAKDIAFGFLLNGTGQVWADGIEIEVVGDDVPTTDLMPNR